VGDKKDRAKGHMKEKTGRALGKPGLTESGRRDQMKGDAKAGGKKLKDAAKKM
jgi:uncharacterized protein YjbJ (UPF0337 family)